MGGVRVAHERLPLLAPCACYVVHITHIKPTDSPRNCMPKHIHANIPHPDTQTGHVLDVNGNAVSSLPLRT